MRRLAYFVLTLSVLGLASMAPSETVEAGSRTSTFQVVNQVSTTPPASDGCTAFAFHDGGVTWWGGCPSNACGGSLPCQIEDPGSSPVRCKCEGGAQPYGKCRASVYVDEHWAITGWSCSNQNCGQSCTMADPGDYAANVNFTLCYC